MLFEKQLINCFKKNNDGLKKKKFAHIIKKTTIILFQNKTRI